MHECNIFISAFKKLHNYERTCSVQAKQSKSNFPLTSWCFRLVALATLEAHTFSTGLCAKIVGTASSFNFHFAFPNNLFHRSTLSSKQLGTKGTQRVQTCLLPFFAACCFYVVITATRNPCFVLIYFLSVFCKSGHILYNETLIDYAAELNITLEVKNIILFTVTSTES